MSIDKAAIYDWWGGNDWLFQAINGINLGSGYDEVMIQISRFSEQQNFPYYFAAIFAWAALSILYRLITRQAGMKHYVTSWVLTFLVLGAGFATEAVTVKAMKDYYAYPRPYLVYTQQQMRSLEYKAGDEHKSFPSGHAAFATLMLVGLWPMLSSGAAYLGTLMVLAVCWSRIAVGAHFPADVIGSLLMVMLMVMILRGIIRMLLRGVGLRC
jgi:membrane-associated phospholipid phosphatase